MFAYEISVQFKRIAKFDEEAKEKIKEAVEYYNGVSMMARNPKKIEDYDYSDDDMTLLIKLNSEEELPMPSKALRMFSVYLANECGFDRYLSGRNLFKMSVGEGNEPESYVAIEERDNVEELMSCEEFEGLSIDDKLNQIYRVLRGLKK